MANNVDPTFAWSSLKPMPTKRVFATAIGVRKDLYMLGGCDAKGVPLDTMESINLDKKKSWNRLGNIPTARAGICAVTVGNHILTFGGVEGKQLPTDCVEIYDTECKNPTKAWIKGDTMTEKLMGVSAVVKEEKVYVAGGMGEDSNPKDYLMWYDPTIDKWGKNHSMPTPRYATFSFMIDQRLYVLGGRQSKQPMAANESFDFREGKWHKLKDIPGKRVFSLYTAAGDNIYSVAGLNADAKKGFSDVIEVYDIRADDWMIGSPSPTKRGDFAIGFQGGKVIAAGGLGNEGKPLDVVDTYDLATDTWTTIQSMPNKHCSCAYTMYNDQLYVGGGFTDGGPSNQVETLSLSSNSASSKTKKS